MKRYKEEDKEEQETTSLLQHKQARVSTQEQERTSDKRGDKSGQECRRGEDEGKTEEESKKEAEARETVAKLKAIFDDCVPLLRHQQQTSSTTETTDTTGQRMKVKAKKFCSACCAGARMLCANIATPKASTTPTTTSPSTTTATQSRATRGTSGVTQEELDEEERKKAEVWQSVLESAGAARNRAWCEWGMGLKEVMKWQQSGQGLEALDQSWFGLVDAARANAMLWRVLCGDDDEQDAAGDGAECDGSGSQDQESGERRTAKEEEEDEDEKEREEVWRTWEMEVDVERGVRAADDALAMDHLLDRVLSDVSNATRMRGRARTRGVWSREQQSGAWMRCVCACGVECVRGWKWVWARRCVERVVGVLVGRHGAVFSDHEQRVLCGWRREACSSAGSGGSGGGCSVSEEARECGGRGGDRANAFERDVAKWQQLDVPHGKARNNAFF